MTRNLTHLKALSVSLLALSVTACSSVAPQDGVIATDMTGTFSQIFGGRAATQHASYISQPYNIEPQMWSDTMTGELRPAPQPHYSFQSSDASLNTARLERYVAAQHSQNSSYQPRSLRRHEPAPHMPPRNIETRKVSKNPWSRRKEFSQSKSVMSGYETGYESQKEALMESSPPPQSQPILADPQEARDAYPAQAIIPTVKQASTPDYSYASNPFPPRASIDDNLAKTGRQSGALDPVVSQNAAQGNWQAANQEIGDSLSYVKMGGGSRISDWQACEKQAGNYFVTTASGFEVEPKFDACMRASGYKPEAEAEAEMSAQAG